MKKNLDAYICDIEGIHLVDERTKKKQKLCEMSAVALSAYLPDEKPEPDTAEKIRRAILAHKIFPGGELELTIDECALIKKVTELMYRSPLVVYQIHQAIDKEIS